MQGLSKAKSTHRISAGSARGSQASVVPHPPSGSPRYVTVEEDSPSARSKRLSNNWYLYSFTAEFIEDNKGCCYRLTSCCRAFSDHPYWIPVALVLTLFALLGDDIRLMFTDKSFDTVYSALTVVCIVAFSIEIVVNSIGKDDYLFGFFFILDIVSTGTLLLDLDWVSTALFGDGESDDLDQTRSGRTARVGSKAGRVVRILKIVRILKFYKDAYIKKRRMNSDAARKEDYMDQLRTEANATSQRNLANMQESRVGKRLSELTIRRVIILVLTMLIVVPMLRAEPTLEVPSSGYFGADVVYAAFQEWVEQRTEDAHLRYENALLRYIYYHNWFAEDSRTLSHVFWIGFASTAAFPPEQAGLARLRRSTVEAWPRRKAARAFTSIPEEVQEVLTSEWTTGCHSPMWTLMGFSILQRKIEGHISHAIRCPNDLRTIERSVFLSEQRQRTGAAVAGRFAVYFDRRPFTHEQALYGCVLTLFVCLVLIIASLMFSSLANQLVLQPLEAMINRVAEIRNNPIGILKMADDEFKLEEWERMQGEQAQQKKCRFFCGMISSAGAVEPMETVILEKTILKLGSLLVLSFGVAGENIICANMSVCDSAGVTALIPGARVECIIGKIGIQDFSTATEVLQGHVMTFVNQVAEVVHGIVDEYFGVVNKNSGETFLLIWRLSRLEVEEDVTAVADYSCIAFAQIHSAIHRSTVLAEYRKHPGLQQRLGSYCRVQLGFGLHAGWAIEGAVGTEYKIEASYLSPNVSIASAMQSAATFYYGVPIVLSEAVVALNSSTLTERYRHIDYVSVRGSTRPIKVYSLDLDFREVEVDKPAETRPWNPRLRFKVRQFLESEKRTRWQHVRVAGQKKLDDEIEIMRRRFTTEFLQVFKMGFSNYFEGEWDTARRLLNTTRTMLNAEDGPSIALLGFMESYGFHAPPHWGGVRELVFDGIDAG